MSHSDPPWQLGRIPTEEALRRALDEVLKPSWGDSTLGGADYDREQAYHLLTAELKRRNVGAPIPALPASTCGDDERQPVDVDDLDPVAILDYVCAPYGPDKWLDDHHQEAQTLQLVALREADRQGLRVRKQYRDIWDRVPDEELAALNLELGPAEPLEIPEEWEQDGVMTGKAKPMPEPRPGDLVFNASSGPVHISCGHGPNPCPCKLAIELHKGPVLCWECGAPGRFAFIHAGDGIVATCQSCHEEANEMFEEITADFRDEE